MVRKFNTAGPIISERHYHVPPLSRVDRHEILELIDDLKYFVLHAPRQTGKTTVLGAFQTLLNENGSYRCVYVNIEEAQTARVDVRRGMEVIVDCLAMEAEFCEDDTFPANWREIVRTTPPDRVLRKLLAKWAVASPKPLVLLIDEIDALIGDTLVSVLRQLRSGYRDRPLRFPQSVVLCGVRDVRDYPIYVSADDQIILGGSAFNIKAESLRLRGFDEHETRLLLRQHTKATGQPFADAAVEEIWRVTRGQPWLVNALAYQLCFAKEGVRDRSVEITRADAIEARERLILRRDTHLDQLAHKLSEPRVRRVIEPILTGGKTSEPRSEDDLKYVRDLGLVTSDGLAIANPIYREVIPRQLSHLTQLEIMHSQTWYVSVDGRLMTDKLMRAFQSFYRENSEHWIDRYQYKEAGPHLLLQAFLQRIVNAGGRIEREYAVGRRRMDLAIIWNGAREQRAVVECKIVRKGLGATLRDGLEQTAAYMDVWNAEEGHLVLFDRSPDKRWEEKIFRREEKLEGRRITVWGM